VDADEVAEGGAGEEAGLGEGEDDGGEEVELYGAGLEVHEKEGDDGDEVGDDCHEAAAELGGAHFAASLWGKNELDWGIWIMGIGLNAYLDGQIRDEGVDEGEDAERITQGQILSPEPVFRLQSWDRQLRHVA
jgi:hypothetical protein